MQIKGQVAIISGGGSGLGAATARALAQAGARVAILDIAAEQAQQIAKEIGGVAYVSDVTDAEQLSSVMDELAATLGDIRICVNCAGIAPAKRIVGRGGAMPLDDFEKVIAVNLIGTFNVMRLVAAKMSVSDAVNADGERGIIINTASIAAYEGQIGQIAYSASKGGIVAMTVPAARELGRFGIRVVTVSPGVFATPMMTAMPVEVQESLAQAVPFPQRLGKPQEYAQTVMHLIENIYINGVTVRLDGAVHLG